MARIEVMTHIEASPERVWAVLTDWEAQPTWMVDARSVEVTSDHREGVGVVLDCLTDLAGFVVMDRMETIEWDESRVIGVRHLGPLVRGVGAFELLPTDWGVHFTWWEELDPPLGPVGELGATLLVVPFVRRTFRRSIGNLKRLCESQAVRP